MDAIFYFLICFSILGTNYLTAYWTYRFVKELTRKEVTMTLKEEESAPLETVTNTTLNTEEEVVVDSESYNKIIDEWLNGSQEEEEKNGY